MIRVSVMYPNQEESTFDMDYYMDSHVPMVKEKLGDACKEVSIDKGMAGMAPGSPPAYQVVAHMKFDSVEAFQGSFGPNAEKILGDIPNFTSVEPSALISEIVG